MKKLTILLITTLLTISCANASTKKVLMMVSEGFYAPEYYKPLAAYKSAGFEVVTATKYPRLTKTDERQVNEYAPVRGDITFDKIIASDYDAITFVGGNGAWEDFFPNQTVHRLLQDFLEQKKVVGLLCSATGLLGVANNLSGQGEPLAKGRNVTGYKRVKGLLIELGKVNYHGGTAGKPFVVVDENLITGRDPNSSELFAKKVVEALNQ